MILKKKIISLACVAALFPAWATVADAADAGSAVKGKTAYVKHGCWQCHGFVGQGGIAGPKLAPDVKPLAFYTAFVRNSNGPMPPYSEAILSNADMGDLHAYMLSMPKAPDAKSIPLLNP